MIFTTLFDDSYFCGLVTLMQSMRENSELSAENTSFILVYEDKPEDKQKEILSELYPNISYIPRDTLGDVSSHTKQDRSTMYVALKKMLMFGLPVNESVCFIDADMLCLNPMIGIESLPPFSAVLDLNGAGLAYSVLGRTMFNTGFFMYEPSRVFMEELIEYYHTAKYPFDTLGDQTVINYFIYEKYPEMMHATPREWNVLKRFYLWDQDFSLDRIKLLHYVGIKPWEVHRYGEQFEWRYRDLNRLWWQYFKRSPGFTYCCDRYLLSEPDWKKLDNKCKWYEVQSGISRVTFLFKRKLSSFAK